MGSPEFRVSPIRAFSARYRRVLAQAAEAAHDAAQTAAVVGALEVAGKVTGPFATTAFDDAAKGLSGAEQKFAAEGPPDTQSAGRRDRLNVLLGSAVTALGDTAQADDDSGLRAGVARLNDIAKQLDDFVEELG
jgi:hypothetical protein